MINLQFNYSIKYEIQRIKYTLSKINWFKDKGYKFFLPKNFLLEENEKFIDEEYINNSIVDEYDKKDYKKVTETINERWLKFSPLLENYFLETKIKPKDIYEVKLTKYGVGGSYNLPNTIIINTQARYGVGLIKTIIHEIVHLSIQNLIEKYEVEHWKKERIVDLILNKYVSEINKMQNIPIDTKLIDEVFEKYYPDVEEVIKKVADPIYSDPIYSK